MQARRGELIDAIGEGGLVAMRDGRPVAVLFWRIERDRAASTSAEVTLDRRERDPDPRTSWS